MLSCFVAISLSAATAQPLQMQELEPWAQSVQTLLGILDRRLQRIDELDKRRRELGWNRNIEDDFEAFIQWMRANPDHRTIHLDLRTERGRAIETILNLWKVTSVPPPSDLGILLPDPAVLRQAAAAYHELIEKHGRRPLPSIVLRHLEANISRLDTSGYPVALWVIQKWVAFDRPVQMDHWGLFSPGPEKMKWRQVMEQWFARHRHEFVWDEKGQRFVSAKGAFAHPLAEFFR